MNLLTNNVPRPGASGGMLVTAGGPLKQAPGATRQPGGSHRRPRPPAAAFATASGPAVASTRAKDDRSRTHMLDAVALQDHFTRSLNLSLAGVAKKKKKRPRPRPRQRQGDDGGGRAVAGGSATSSLPSSRPAVATGSAAATTAAGAAAGAAASHSSAAPSSFLRGGSALSVAASAGGGREEGARRRDGERGEGGGRDGARVSTRDLGIFGVPERDEDRLLGRGVDRGSIPVVRMGGGRTVGQTTVNSMTREGDDERSDQVLQGGNEEKSKTCRSGGSGGSGPRVEEGEAARRQRKKRTPHSPPWVCQICSWRNGKRKGGTPCVDSSSGRSSNTSTSTMWCSLCGSEQLQSMSLGT
jgi:hypothetical protein